MSRTPQSQILLSIDEFEWAAGMLSRKVIHLDKSSDKRLNGIVSGLANKVEAASANPPTNSSEFTLPTNRNELRYLETVAKNTRDAYVNAGKGLRDRVETKPEHRDYLLKKSAEADSKATMLTTLLAKIERLL